MKQISLFESDNDILYSKINSLLSELIVQKELPPSSLHLFSNKSVKGKNAGNVTSKSICIYEPDYPSIKLDIDNPNKNFVILKIQPGETCELFVRNSQFSEISLPASATVKSLRSDTSFVHVLFNVNDANLLEYIKENILFCLSHYHSKASSFGCCSRFKKCSDAMQCVHDNKLYSTACMYRRHLEAGRISYGKNKNI